MATRLFEESSKLSSSEFARFPRYTAISFISPPREENVPLKYRSLSRNSLLSGFRCSFETDLPPPPPPPLTVVSRTRLITTSDDEPGFELFHGRFSNCETPTRYQATTDSSNSVIRTEAVRGGLSLRCHARNVKTHGRTKSLITARILRFFARLPFSSPSPREDRTP